MSIINCGHIYHWDTKGVYDYDGLAKKFIMKIKLESGLGENDFIKLVWPLSLGTAS